jgi:hypothetical protein
VTNLYFPFFVQNSDINLSQTKPKYLFGKKKPFYFINLDNYRDLRNL